MRGEHKKEDEPDKKSGHSRLTGQWGGARAAQEEVFFGPRSPAPSAPCCVRRGPSFAMASKRMCVDDGLLSAHLEPPASAFTIYGTAVPPVALQHSLAFAGCPAPCPTTASTLLFALSRPS